LFRHDGLTILATNRPYDLDEAMQRRITLSIPFRPPDHLLRYKIWKNHIPPKLPLADDVDLHVLSMKFELTGGFIKNGI
jgi:SpoVK/Ycf46/Vps4 family AAA+-type ATPase